jgi:hypothetical protein
MTITAEEMQAIVGPLREYVDTKMAELADEVGWRLVRVEEKLDHPALVLDYRAWVVDVAVELGVTAKELVDAKKKAKGEMENGEGGDGGDGT